MENLLGPMTYFIFPRCYPLCSEHSTWFICVNCMWFKWKSSCSFPHTPWDFTCVVFFATFNLLRILSSKFIGVLSMLSLPLFLALLPFLENLVKYQSPFRRPAMSVIYIFYVAYAIWLSLGSRHHHWIFTFTLNNSSSTFTTTQTLCTTFIEPLLFLRPID